MKKLCVFVVMLMCCVCCFNFCSNKNMCFANQTQNQISDELADEIKSQTDDIDFSELEKYVQSISNESFGFSSFKELVQSFLNGEENFDLSLILEMFFSSFKQSFVSLLPTVALIFVIAFFYNIFSKTTYCGTDKIVYLICFVSISVLIVALISKCHTETLNLVLSLKKQIDLVFPILLTLMVSLGASVSVGIYQPIVSFLNVIITGIISGVLLKIVSVCLALCVVGRLSEDLKLSKMVSLLQSVFKWMLGVVCSLYLGTLSLKAIAGSSADGISIKATKYALKNYIPYLGGFLSEGFEVFRAGSTLIKNSVGLSAIVLLLCTIAVPLVSLVSLNLILKFASALCEPLSDGKISGFLADISKCVNMLVACLVAIVVIYFVTVLLIISTANYVF